MLMTIIYSKVWPQSRRAGSTPKWVGRGQVEPAAGEDLELLVTKPSYNLFHWKVDSGGLFPFQLFLHVLERRVLSGRAGLAVSKVQTWL